MIFGMSRERYHPVFGVKGTFNSEAIIAYLKMIRLGQHKIGKNERNYMIVWDNASIHRSSKMLKFLEWSKIRLITIPAYSPWLNPVEHMIGSF